MYIAAPSRNRVFAACCIVSACRRTLSAQASSECTDGSSCSPCSLSRIIREVRWNSRKPSVCSNSLIWPDTVGCVRLSRSAARVTESSSATAAKLRSNLKSRCTIAPVASLLPRSPATLADQSGRSIDSPQLPIGRRHGAAIALAAEEENRHDRAEPSRDRRHHLRSRYLRRRAVVPRRLHPLAPHRPDALVRAARLSPVLGGDAACRHHGGRARQAQFPQRSAPVPRHQGRRADAARQRPATPISPATWWRWTIPTTPPTGR